MSEVVPTARFLEDLASRGVHLWADGANLRYRAPQGALDSSLFAELGSRKSEILDLLLRRREATPRSAVLKIVPAPASRHLPFPLTDIQQAYWVGRHASFELGASAHLYQEREVEGLDWRRFTRAWQRLVERHEMLRARFTDDGRQRIGGATAAVIPVVDLRGIGREAASEEQARLRRRMKREGPAIERAPYELIATLCDGGVLHIHLTLSLLICDAVSSDVLFRELLQLYQFPDRQLPALELSYRDYVLAQVEAEASESYRRAEEYWRRRLATLPPAPELPLARRPADLPAARFARRTHALDPATWQRFKERAGRHGLTPAAVVCSAYSEVLAAWSGNRHFLLNILFFSRPLVHPQINQVVGNFSTTIPLEVDAGRDGSFSERAERLQRQLWADIEHAQVSGVRVLRELHRLGGDSTRPKLPVVFASNLGLQPSSRTALGGNTGESRPEYDSMQTPQVWLDHQVYERDGSLHLNWDAIEELFPPGLMAEMFAAYTGLLQRLADDEGLWAEVHLPLVPAASLARRAAVNATEAPIGGELLHTLFARQARQRPDEPAVFAPGRTLTYRELERRARQLGRRLRELGAGPGERVAVVMERGWEQVVAVLGVLESGAAYVPVDAALPSERRRYLLDHAQARLAVTQPWIDAGIDWPPAVTRLAVADGEEPDGGGTGFEDPVQGPGDLAYIIYTSGSTGLPKGVMIDHRGAVNTILDINRRFGVGPGDRVLALSSLSFDLSVYDVFGLLAAGGAIVLPEATAATEPARWLELCHTCRVSLWNTVPALMEMLADYCAGRAELLPESLRVVMMSGDWIPVSLPDRIRVLRPEVRVYSLGGATEASIWSICHPVETVDPAWTSIPYGRPLDNQAFHVLNERLEDCPDWVPGSLYIEGVGLALGYWGDEERTAASFRRHPLSGRRIYRTGDLGRYLPDATLEILGREDFQVKIQGYRIELGEIEAALLQHGDVRAAAVAAVGQARGSKRLVGYVVPATERPGLLDDLHAFLAAKLPAYMVPAKLVELADLPLTPNGKVDRAALARPEAAGSERAGELVPPRSAAERLLAALWSEILGRETVGVRDHFFELGGHSLLAVRLMTRIRQETGTDLPLSALLEAPTIEQLAPLVTRDGGPLQRSPLVAIQTGGAGAPPPVFCVHPVGGNVLCYVELARSLGTDRPFYGLQVEDFGEEEPAPLTIEELAARYVRAVRERSPEGPYQLSGWSMGGVVAFEMACQLRAAGHEVSSLVLLDAEVPRREVAGYGTVDDALLVSWFARDLGGLLGRELSISPASLRGLDPESRLRHVLARARELELPQEVTLEQARRMLAVFQRNFRALLAYVPPVYPGPLVLLRAASSGRDDGDPSLGWAAVAAGGARVETIPGDHYTMMQPPSVEALAERMRLHLAQPRSLQEDV